MTPRGAKDPSFITTPPKTASGSPPMHTPSSNNHDFHLQSVMQTERSIGKIEACIQNLTASSEKHEAKLDKISEDIHTAKGIAKAMAWILAIIGAIGLALLAAIFNLLSTHFGK